MEAFNGLDSVREELGHTFDYWEGSGQARKAIIVGFLVARPSFDIVRDRVLPSINYWHFRSDYWTVFFWLGYSRSNRQDIAGAAVVDGEKWDFRDDKLSSGISEVETISSWRYDGGVSILLANALRQETGEVLLDFKSAIAFDLVEALSRDGYNTPDRIMECIFSFAKEVNEYGTNPTGGLSATWALRNGRRTLREFILNYIPSYFAKSLREAVAFSARDLG